MASPARLKQLLTGHEFRRKLWHWLRTGKFLLWLYGQFSRRFIQAANQVMPAAYRREYCPVCGWRGYRFLPLAGLYTYRPRSGCPQCGSMNRHRALIRLLDDRRMVAPRMLVLDIGPWDGLRRYVEKQEAFYISTDLGVLPADTRMDIQTLAVKSASLDLVICFHVLEFVPQWEKALAEFYRVLKPGGQLILAENYLYGQPALIEFDRRILPTGSPPRRFGEDLPAQLVKMGFAVEPYDYLNRHDQHGDWFFLCVKPCH